MSRAEKYIGFIMCQTLTLSDGNWVLWVKNGVRASVEEQGFSSFFGQIFWHI